MGKRASYAHAAKSLGRALAGQNRPLVYGGGASGIMGVVSGAALDSGGEVTGVIPYAMLARGGEKDKFTGRTLEDNREGNKQTVVVDSMHERKVEMAKRSAGFIGLPGGFGIFEEVMEVTTWTQIGLHHKPVILLNVENYYEPLKQLIDRGVEDGFINMANKGLITFVDGPSSVEEHATFDWGKAALNAFDKWTSQQIGVHPMFDWSKT